MSSSDFTPLIEFLGRVPPIHPAMGSGHFPDGNWWVKLTIDIAHPLAWSAVQELGYVLNYLSVEERLPTVFMPVSPPPYLNGGPEFLSWVIESRVPTFTPAEAAQWLSSRLPNPVDDPKKWPVNESE